MCAVKISRIGKFDLNPRGNLWLKDENRFGVKLLSRMGWSQGKGLGKNEDGISENLKVGTKFGNAGVGWTEKLPCGINTQEYDAVLEKLNKVHQKSNMVINEDNEKSLEKRSQQFKNRLHYQKFVRGKDVGQYSEKDMNSIFISQAIKQEQEPRAVKSSVTNVQSRPDEASSESSVPTFKSTLSMADYFALKLKKKQGELSKASSKEESITIEDSCSAENQSSCRKRKKKESQGAKKCKRIRLEGEEEESPPESVTEESSSGYDNSEMNSAEACNTEIRKENISHADSNKHKKGKLEKLKSCLKRSWKTGPEHWFKRKSKEVSFSDKVSCKIIEDKFVEVNSETETESSDLGTSSDSEDEDESQGTTEKGSSEETESDDDGFVEESQNAMVGDCRGEDCSVEFPLMSNLMEAVEENPECFDLPRCETSNYDSWLEMQRIAMRMKIYRNMMKKMRRHPVLRKTNILSIKGYGNWKI